MDRVGAQGRPHGAFLDDAERRRKLNVSDGWHWIQGNGIHRGRLMGGCIEVLDWLRGTDVWPRREAWKDAIAAALPEKLLELNLRAFDVGLSARWDPRDHLLATPCSIW